MFLRKGQYSYTNVNDTRDYRSYRLAPPPCEVRLCLFTGSPVSLNRYGTCVVSVCVEMKTLLVKCVLVCCE